MLFTETSSSVNLCLFPGLLLIFFVENWSRIKFNSSESTLMLCSCKMYNIFEKMKIEMGQYPSISNGDLQLKVILANLQKLVLVAV